MLKLGTDFLIAWAPLAGDTTLEYLTGEAPDLFSLKSASCRGLQAGDFASGVGGNLFTARAPLTGDTTLKIHTPHPPLFL